MVLRLVRELILEKLRKVPSSVEVSLPYIYSMISTLVMPEPDRDLFISQINCLVSEFLKELNEKQTAVGQMEIFNHIFFNRHHFQTEGLSLGEDIHRLSPFGNRFPERKPGGCQKEEGLYSLNHIV